MLRSTLRSWAKLLLLVLITLPVIASAKSTAKKEPIDLSIIEQSNALLLYMTATQRIQYLKLERALVDAESDLRSGQNLAETKPSTFDPNRDLKPLIERGQKLIESAQLRIDTTQMEIVALLTTVEGQKAVEEVVDEMRFDYALESLNFEEALATRCQKLLETCWELGYETLFFDGVFIQDSEGTHRSNADLRNGFYDALVKIDGTTFSVTIPIGFQLKADALGKGSQIFSYENASIFEEDHKALLAIELILPEGSSTGLLSLKAIDLETQLIAAQQIVKVEDLATILGIETEGLKDQILEQVKLRDEANTLERLSRLNEPYTFEIEFESATKEVVEILTHTLLSNTDLQVANSDFILRAYGEALDLPDSWQGQANARLRAIDGDEADSYQLSAQANDSDRILPGGTLTLSQSASEVMAEVE